MAVAIEAWRGMLDAAERKCVFDLYQTIFKNTDASRFEQKWTSRMSAAGLTLLAFSGNQAIGYKVGYPLDETVFYSWIGGVVPAFRRKGVGQQLLDYQHNWCRQHGYQIIQTKTLNQWKSMLLLNIQNGFDIADTYKDSKGTLKIVLEKKLNN